MLGRTILPILGASLLEPSAEQRGPFKEAILCVKGLIFFHLMVKYRSHTDQTIGYMCDRGHRMEGGGASEVV